MAKCNQLTTMPFKVLNARFLTLNCRKRFDGSAAKLYFWICSTAHIPDLP